MLRRVWSQLAPLLDRRARRHVRLRYRVGARGELDPDQLEETFRLDTEAGETTEAFLLRVWKAYKLSAGDLVEFSTHDGRMTARVVRSAARVPAATELHAAVTALSAQLARYEAHLVQTEVLR
jgi:hypothetical protein